MDNHIQANKTHWNQKVAIHLNSDFYNQKGFLAGETSLKKPELDLLGDVAGKKILHLQCHFGQDSISLSRMGAQVTGVDFSDEAISVARETAENLGVDTKFICCNVFDLSDHLDEQFDIVFASYGVISWHPDLALWSQLVEQYVKPGGCHIFVEFHPYIWMWEDNLQRLAYSYFNEGSIKEEETGTYADREADIKTVAYCWNHSLQDSLQSALDAGLTLVDFREYNYSPYNIFENMLEVEHGFQIRGMENKIPMVFSMVVEKPINK